MIIANLSRTPKLWYTNPPQEIEPTQEILSPRPSQLKRVGAVGGLVLTLAACTTTPPPPAALPPSPEPWQSLVPLQKAHLGGGGTSVAAGSLPVAPALGVAIKGAPGRDTPATWTQRLREGLALSAVDHPAIDRQLERFHGDRVHLEILQERAQHWLPFLIEAVADRGLPQELAVVPVVESALEPMALSSRSAAGLWQIVPDTARFLGLEQRAGYDGRHDPVAATRAALDYFEYLVVRFEGDWLLALAAYNAGEGRVASAMAEGNSTVFWNLDLPRETRQYVPRVLATARLFAHPKRAGLPTLGPLPNPRSTVPPAVRRTLTRYQVQPGDSLLNLAQRFGVPTDALRRWNRLPPWVLHVEPGRELRVLLATMES
ncbi:MAG: transglycosylase SLT domain-containing protein [Candidatus Competibacterales bacterium]